MLAVDVEVFIVEEEEENKESLPLSGKCHNLAQLQGFYAKIAFDLGHNVCGIVFQIACFSN